MDSNANNTNVNENMNTPSQEDRWAQYRSAYSNPQAAAAPGTAAVPPKKSHKGLIIFLIILGVALALLLIGGMALKNTVSRAMTAAKRNRSAKPNSPREAGKNRSTTLTIWPPKPPTTMEIRMNSSIPTV